MPHTPENQNQSINHQHPGIPPLTFDPDIYRHYIKDFDLTEEEQIELLEALWKIVVNFVDLGFGIEASQYALKAGLAVQASGDTSCHADTDDHEERR